MIPFLRYKKIYLIIGSITVIVSLILIFKFGLKPAIDFTGGSIVDVQVCTKEETECKLEEFKQAIVAKYNEKSIEGVIAQINSENTVTVKSKEIDQTTWTDIKSTLTTDYPTMVENGFETIGPTLGQELVRKTTYAIILASLGLLIYIGSRFKGRLYGITAVVAMIHDVLVILAAFAVFGKLYGVEVDVMFVTAALTTLAFSVHDTIVLFDRIRETLRRSPNDDFEHIANHSINATMIRSLSTTLAIIFVLVSLLLLGGENVRWFVVAHLVGTITGVYSSPFIATPLVVILKQRQSKKSFANKTK